MNYQVGLPASAPFLAAPAKFVRIIATDPIQLRDARLSGEKADCLENLFTMYGRRPLHHIALSRRLGELCLCVRSIKLSGARSHF